MTPVEVTVLVALAALVGLIAGFAGARVQDRFRLTKSQSDAKDIIARAEKEAENLRKEAELKTKDDFFKKREEFNREVEKERHEVREQERRLEKREDTLDQKHQVLLKKERSLEHTQRKLHERREQVEKRGQELETLLQEQTQKLHEITGLNREQAEALLLQRLEKALSDEIAGRIQKHEEGLKARQTRPFQIDPRRSHPPLADRGSRQGNAGGNGKAHYGNGQASRSRSRHWPTA